MDDSQRTDSADASVMNLNSNPDSLPLLDEDDNGGDTEEWEDELPGEEQEDDDE